MPRVGYWRAIFSAGPQAWGTALLEILVVATISLIPLLMAAIRELLPLGSNILISDAFQRSFLSGQLVFYSVGLIATITWNSNKDFQSFFPWRTIFNLYCLAGIVFCTLLIGYDPTLSRIKPSILSVASVGIFLVTLVAYILMAVISQVHVNVGEALAKTDADLQNEVRRSRGIS